MNSKRQIKAPGSETSRRSERGIALLICIGFLALLSILGVIVVQFTEQGISSTRKDRTHKEAFALGDGGVEYALALGLRGDINLNTPLDLTSDDPVTGEPFLDAFFPDDDIECLGPGRCMMTYEGSGTEVPANAAKYDATISAANAKIYRYFHIVMETRHSTDATIPPVKIDALMAQAFPSLTGIPIEVVKGTMDTPDAGGN
jgi:hypothetical protein